MEHCLICNTSVEPFVSFGKMPLANGFLGSTQFAHEYFYDLKLAFCSNCRMVQLVEQPDREAMFNDHYPFFSGTSELMELHFKDFAEVIQRNYFSNEDPFIVEIGSNDGIMLKHFAAKGIRHLGIEPSSNVAQVAISNGLSTICDFFDEQLALKIVEEHGQADVFAGANVMCHIPYLHSVVEGIRVLLKPSGVALFEDPYLGDVIEKTTYDQIYDEHTFLFSASSISYLVASHGMELVDVELQDTHGGSMRYIIAPKGSRPVSPMVQAQLEKEERLGLHRNETYEAFRKNCEHSRDSLMMVINDIKRQGKRIVGYAATSKSTTIINYCGITTEHIEYICDTTPIKQGKFSPGAHIPIKPYEAFLAEYPDYALLFAYNHSKEIMAKERRYMQSGGKWITYVPKVHVIE